MQQDGSIQLDELTILKPRSFANESAAYAFIDRQRDYLARWVPWFAEYSPEKLHQDITDTLQETADGTFFLFDIFYRDTFVGAVNAEDVIAGKSATLGYYVGEEYAGKGLATKSMSALIEFLVDHSSVHHLTLEIFEGNDASVRVAEKLGFSYATQQQVGGRTELVYKRTI
jgi:ribosomal-protein-serine acetyltransferase